MTPFSPPPPLPLLLTLLLFILAPPAACSTHPQDQAALDAFYYALTSKGSLPSTLPSDWCTEISGILCDNGKVFKIDLHQNQMAGPISSSLGNLTSLEYLDLSENLLSGTIPSSLGKLSSMNYLELAYNQISGTIPSVFGEMKALELLNLKINRLSGTIPSTLESLTSLTELDLHSNEISGTLPSFFGKLATLKYLDLSANQFSGTIPLAWTNLAFLENLNVERNRLNGTIPNFLGNMASLQLLDLSLNSFSGSIPSSLASLTSLTWLKVSSNQLSGTIPSILSNITSLVSLDLHSNKLSGSIPSSFANLTFLMWLNLEGNQLSGTIPSVLGNLTRLQYLHLMGTNNYCPMIDYSSWAPYNDFPRTTTCKACAPFTCQNNGSCSGGLNELFSCSCAPGWIGTNCELVGCHEEIFMNSTFPTSPPGTLITIPCQPGFNGSLTRICSMDGIWKTEADNCEQLFCPPADENNASFPSTAAGLIANGTCNLNFTGLVFRPCNLNGTWEAISGSCEPIPPPTSPPTPTPTAPVDPNPTKEPLPTDEPGEQKKPLGAGAKAGIVIGTLFGALVLFGIGVYFYRGKSSSNLRGGGRGREGYQRLNN